MNERLNQMVSWLRDLAGHAADMSAAAARGVSDEFDAASARVRRTAQLILEWVHGGYVDPVHTETIPPPTPAPTGEPTEGSDKE